MVEVYSGIAVFALILGIGLIQFARDSTVLVNKNKSFTKEHFIELFGEIENARYFTTGHPYIWVEVTLEEILKKFYGIPLDKLSKSF